MKISILLLYARIFPSRSFCIAASIQGSIVVRWVVAIICMNIFQCPPIEKACVPPRRVHASTLRVLHCESGAEHPHSYRHLHSAGARCLGTCMRPSRISYRLRYCCRAVCLSQFPRIAEAADFVNNHLTNSIVFTSTYRFSALFEFQPTDTPWTVAKACI